MGKPKAPPPPDYAALAAQQGTESRATAEYNARLNRVNQIDPNGATLTWTTQKGPDGQPIWTQTTSYSPEQQKLIDSGNRINQNLAGVAEAGLNRVGAGMATPFDTSQLPALQGGFAAGDFKTSAPGAGPIQTGLASAGAVNGQGPAAGDYRTGQLNMGQVLRHVEAPEITNQVIGNSLDTSGVRSLPTAVDNTSRQRVEQAIMSRMDPQFQQQEDSLRAKLANQGIEVGSAAYDREMQNLNQAKNDARMQAVLAGGQEESRQVGLNQSLQNQEFGQALQKGQMGNQVAQFNSGQNLAAQQATGQNKLSAQQQVLQALLQGYGLQTTANGQNFQQDLASRAFGNEAQQQQFTQNLATQQANNQAQQQQFTQNQQELAASNQAVQAKIAAALQQAQFSNQARQQGLQEQAWLRQLPLNELNALRTGTQVQAPQFSNYYTGSSASAAPIFDAGMAQANYNMNQYQTQMQGYNAMLGGLASLGGQYMQGMFKTPTPVPVPGKG